MFKKQEEEKKSLYRQTQDVLVKFNELKEELETINKNVEEEIELYLVDLETIKSKLETSYELRDNNIDRIRELKMLVNEKITYETE